MRRSYYLLRITLYLVLLPINETVLKGKFNQEITKGEHHSVLFPSLRNVFIEQRIEANSIKMHFGPYLERCKTLFDKI